MENIHFDVSVEKKWGKIQKKVYQVGNRELSKTHFAPTPPLTQH